MRIVPLLIALALVLGSFVLVACQQAPRPTHSFTVSETCYPIDVNGAPLPRGP
jgi:hypothetical protein